MKAAALCLVALAAAAHAGAAKKPSARERVLQQARNANKAEPVLAEVGAQWRFGSNYVPQHYGNWQFMNGKWNFGNDKRIECEACGYVMYMLIDRLGDQFDRPTVIKEMNELCPRVQWVFESGCQHIFKHYSEPIVKMVMRLTEPEDICKQINLCSPDFYDVAMMGGAAGGMHPGMTHPGMGHPGSFGAMAGPSMGVAGGQAMAHPNLGYAQAGGSGYGLYPSPGMRPVSSASPYSPYSQGGYDGFGFPMPHPGVPSSTPPPAEQPKAGEGGAGSE